MLRRSFILLFGTCLIVASPAWAREREESVPSRCYLELLPNPRDAGDPRIALVRQRGDSEGGDLLLDTGYLLSAVETPRDRRALSRKEGPFVCVIERDGAAPTDWEKALAGDLSPGFRGEALLHMGQASRAVQVFFQGLPDRRCAAWLAQAARNLPAPVAEGLPRALESRDLHRADAALDLLGDLVSSHPRQALGPLLRALHSRHRELLPRALLLAGEEAAGLRASWPEAPEAQALVQRIEEALSGDDPAARGAAGEALLLGEPDPERRMALLVRAAREEQDAAARPLLLSDLLEAGGTEEIFRLTHSPSADLRRDALRAVSGLSEWPAGEGDPLARLLHEEGRDPSEVVRRLGPRPGALPESWVAPLREVLPGMKDADRARVPDLLCGMEGTPAAERGLSLLVEMARDGESGEASLAAVESLGRCGGINRGKSLEALLTVAENARRGEAVRTLAAQEAAALADSPEIFDQLLEFYSAALTDGDEILGRVSVAGLIRLGRLDALRPAALLARRALRTPPDAASRAAEEGLKPMFDLAPGRVTSALRQVGAGFTEEGQERAYELFQRLKPEKRDRILRRWRESLSAPGARMPPEIQAEMRSLVDDWPGEILDLVEPIFAASREEERIRLLELVVELGRQLPVRVLPLLTLPDGASRRVAEATREAVAATLARKVLATPEEGAGPLFDMALDPSDSERRETGRLALWLLARESPSLHDGMIARVRAARSKAAFPLRVELGRWLAQASESGLKRIPVAPERRPEPRKARFLPDISGGSAQSP